MHRIVDEEQYTQRLSPFARAYRAARLVDGTGATPVADAVVVVTDNRIVAAGRASRVAVPAGAHVIDLGDATLLPGFIDAHTHITGRVLGDPRGDDAAVRDFPVQQCAQLTPSTLEG
jgi:imidazolonepropionase-like amidohydrolase